MRKLLYWILFPLCVISIGGLWPIHEAMAEGEFKDFLVEHERLIAENKALARSNTLLRNLYCTSRES